MVLLGEAPSSSDWFEWIKTITPAWIALVGSTGLWLVVRQVLANKHDKEMLRLKTDIDSKQEVKRGYQDAADVLRALLGLFDPRCGTYLVTAQMYAGLRFSDLQDCLASAGAHLLPHLSAGLQDQLAGVLTRASDYNSTRASGEGRKKTRHPVITWKPEHREDVLQVMWLIKDEAKSKGIDGLDFGRDKGRRIPAVTG